MQSNVTEVNMTGKMKVERSTPWSVRTLSIDQLLFCICDFSFWNTKNTEIITKFIHQQMGLEILKIVF